MKRMHIVLMLPPLMIFVPIFAAVAKCENFEKLRLMAKDDFRKERGAKDKLDDERFGSNFHMSGANDCWISVDNDGSSVQYRCMWRLARTLEARSEAKTIFHETVRGFEACSMKADVRQRYSGNGEVAEIELQPLAGSRKPIHTLTFSYSWFAPWWELEIEYQVAKE